MNLLCVDFIVLLSQLREKLCLLETIKRMTKEYVSTLKINMAKENITLDFRLKQ